MNYSKCSETVNLASNSQSDTFNIGIAIASTFYQKNTSLWFRGELGAGKTTLIQGLGFGLGLGRMVMSPTYAIENRYDEKFLHIDLYRLDSGEAKRIVEESESFPGVRAIEWSEHVFSSSESRASEASRGTSREAVTENFSTPRSGSGRSSSLEENSIAITITEPSPLTRLIQITFCDIALPSRADVEAWRKEVHLPEHIGKHCDAVARMAGKLGNELLQKGIPLRPIALTRAAECHDLLRFIDFQPHVQRKIPEAKEPDKETEALWNSLKNRYPAEHEAACAEFLEEHGYPELGTIVRPHGLHSIVKEPETIHTIEQKLLYYADKRVRFESDVTIDERFDEFIERYGDGVESDWAKIARKRTKELEKELFGESLP